MAPERRQAKGAFETYKVENISADTSFLEMLDILNNNLIHEARSPWRSTTTAARVSAVCARCTSTACARPGDGATTCQIYMRRFKDGATIVTEPWRSAAFPVIKDLVVDRSAYDKILQAGGFISVRTNAVQDANNIPIPKADADVAMDAAAASVAVPALRPVRTARRCFSSPPVCRRSRNCRRDVSRVPAAPRRWWPRWTNWASVTVPIRELARPSVRR